MGLNYKNTKKLSTPRPAVAGSCTTISAGCGSIRPRGGDAHSYVVGIGTYKKRQTNLLSRAKSSMNGRGACEDGDEVFDIVIAGGGPGGLATAHGILRALGPDVKLKVLESRARLNPIGAGLVLYPNSLRSLQSVCPDAKKDIIATAAQVTSTKILEFKGSSEQTMNTFLKSNSQANQDPLKENEQTNKFGSQVKEFTVRNAVWDEIKVKYGEAPAVTSWHKCVSSLATRLPENVLELGCKMTSYEIESKETEEDDKQMVRIEYVNSAQGVSKAIRSKLFIGADGYFSKVRDKLLKDGKPTWAGSVIWRALIDDTVHQIPKHTSVLYTGEGIFFVYYPTGENSSCWTATKLISEKTFSAESNGSHRHNDDDDENCLECLPSSIQSDPIAIPRSIGENAFQEVLDNLKDCLPDEYIEMIMETDPLTVTRHGVYIRDPFGKDMLWRNANGPVSLIGDAAHPMRPVGQGNAMALEDAAELAACLKLHGVSQKALREYENVRIPRTRIVAQKSHIDANATYRKGSNDSNEMKLDHPLPKYIRNNNYSADMTYDDWLYDIQFPSLDANVS